MNRPELQRRTGAPISAAQAQRARAAAATRVFAVSIGDESFGLPIEQVQTVFQIAAITPVPLAPPHIVGLINLRGNILTAICLRRRLGLPPNPESQPFAVSLKVGNENFALIVDAVHDVIELRETDRLPKPAHIEEARAQLTQSIYRQGEHLLPVLDLAKTVLARTVLTETAPAA